MKEKKFKILISQFKGFKNAKEKLEQYQTPPETILDSIKLLKNYVYKYLIDKLLENKEINLLEPCAGTFSFSLSFLLDFIINFFEYLDENSKLEKEFKINLDLIEIDNEAIEIGKFNIILFKNTLNQLLEKELLKKIDLNINFMNEDFLNYKISFNNKGKSYDLILINPPFGIKQKNKDLLFLDKSLNLARYILSINNGVTSNKLLKKYNNYLINYQFSKFRIKRQFWYHDKDYFDLDVIILLMKNDKI